MTSAAQLFDLLWESLADVLGTAAGATLLRRPVKQAAARMAWSEPVIVVRTGLDHTYRLPEELTGHVVVTRLGQRAPLRKWGINFYL